MGTYRGQSTGILAYGAAASHEGYQEDYAAKDQDDDGHAVCREGLANAREVLYGGHHDGAEGDKQNAAYLRLEKRRVCAS